MDATWNWSAPPRYALSIGGVVIVTALLTQLPALHETTISMIYLVVVLISATTIGLVPAILASVLSFLAINFFFVPPLHTLAVADPQDIVKLLTFLVVGVIASTLASRAREQANTAQRSATELAALYGLSQTLGAEVSLDRALPLLAQTTIQLVSVPSCAILIYDENGFLSQRALAGAQPSEPTRNVDIFLRIGARVLGVLRVAQRSLQEELAPAEHERLEMIATQVVLVLERARLVDEASRARALAEAERVKGTLFASVSHDLRTPLAVIKGTVTDLLDDAVARERPAQREMLEAVNDEADRLNRLVGNLLEMSRIESGSYYPARNSQDVGELIGNVVARLRSQLARHPITVDIPAELPPVQISYMHIDQVLTNLLENAASYTPDGTPIVVRAAADDTQIEVTVWDRGPGIPEGLYARIFEKFVRVADSERHANGAGLGLAICKGIIEAHGGRIWAESAPGGGAQFVFTLPTVAVPAARPLAGRQL